METEVPESQMFYETPRMQLKEIYKNYDRAHLEAIKLYYLTPKQKEEVKNEVGKIARNWAIKHGP